ncbi:MAG: hypothetical protein RH948_04520 [Cyclobacteriaceae bacterium]
MRNKLDSINNIPFLACLVTLLLNDFYLKAEYHNWLTGKLSDFSGLFVFVLFWTALYPDKKLKVYLFTGLLFIFWKSAYSQQFIDFFSNRFFTIHRVVDLTDLYALAILPVAFFFKPKYYFKLKLSPVLLALLTLFSFCATSVPKPIQKFEHPQYLIFKSEIVNFESPNDSTAYQIYNYDSVAIIEIKEIGIDQKPKLSDEFQKVQILKDLDLRFLRGLDVGYDSQTALEHYTMLRDSLVIGKTTKIILKRDSFTDHLNFKRTRLNGSYERYSFGNKLLIEGKYKNGIEDSIWVVYNDQGEIEIIKYFKEGELIKREFFQKGVLHSEKTLNTRSETVKNKYFHIVIVFVLILSLCMKLLLGYNRSSNREEFQVSDFAKILGSLTLPFLSFFLAKLFSLLIPNSYSIFFLEIIGEVGLIYIIAAPFYLLIFYFLKLHSRYDLVYYIFLTALIIVLLEESIYLWRIAY